MDHPLSFIDEKISYHETQAIIWKRKRNAHARINHLPPEILAGIFQRHVPRKSWKDRGSDYRFFKGLLTVCTHWKDVAIATPDLWTILPCPSTSDTSAAFRRAKNADLVLTFDSHDLEDDSIESTCQLLSAMSRVRALDLTCTPPKLHALIDEHEAPILSFLSIVLDASTYLSPPYRLFQGITPSLRVLRLVQCPKLLEGLDLRELRLLDVAEGTPQVSLSSFADILRATPRIEDISIAHAIWHDTSPSSATSLGHLRRLRVRDELPRPLFGLLRMIRAPVLEDLSVEFVMRDVPMENILEEPIAAEFFRVWTSVLNCASMEEDSDSYRVILSNYSDRDLGTRRGSGRPPRFCYALVADDPLFHVPDLEYFHALLTLAQVFDVQHLRVSSNGRMMWPDTWAHTIMPAWPALRDIEAAAGEAKVLVEALPNLDRNLEHLRFAEVNFKGPNNYEAFADRVVSWNLGKALQARASKGLTVANLHFTRCTVLWCWKRYRAVHGVEEVNCWADRLNNRVDDDGADEDEDDEREDSDDEEDV
jgi:hypothetical protein